MEGQNKAIAIFEDQPVRRSWDEKQEKWYFSVVDIVAILTESVDAGAYWRKLKQRLIEEGSQVVTNCHGLKLEAKDGKKYLTDVADVETIFRLVQSVPSPKAEPIKLWLARVGYERLQETMDPEKSINRAGDSWRSSPSSFPPRRPNSIPNLNPQPRGAVTHSSVFYCNASLIF
jgi:DNA-damage-inducible protein D